MCLIINLFMYMSQVWFSTYAISISLLTFTARYHSAYGNFWVLCSSNKRQGGDQYIITLRVKPKSGGTQIKTALKTVAVESHVLMSSVNRH